MRKVYTFKRLTGQVKRFAAFMLITLLAVGNAFADYDGTGLFTKINSVDELTTGYYVITNQTGEFAMQNQVSTSGTKYIFKTDAVFNNPTADIVWLVSVSDGQITLYNEAANMYAAYSGSGNSAYMIAELSDKARWTATLDDDGNWLLENVATSGRYLNYNTGSPRFACYGNHNQQELSFYKWGEAPALAAPTFSIPSGTYYTEQTVSLTAAPGANIYYSINGGEPILYNAPFTVSTTSTISAYAVLEGATSTTATITITLPVQLANIAALVNANADNSTIYHVTGDMQYVWRHGRNMYLQDATSGLLVFDNSNPVITTEYNNGDVISGGIYGKLTPYNGMVELVPILNTAEGTPGPAIEPIVTTIADIVADTNQYMYRLVALRNGSFQGKTITTGNSSARTIEFYQGGDTIKVYNQFNTVNATFAANEPGVVVGFVAKHNSDIELFPRDNGDLIGTAAPYACDFETGNFEWNIVNGNNTNKWYIGEAQGFNNNKLYISSSNGVTNKYNVLEASVSHAYVYTMLPANDVLLTFDVRTVGDANDFLQVSVLDEAPVAGTLPSNYLTRIYGVNEFTTQTLLIPASNAGAKYIVFTWKNDGSNGTQQPAAIDNVAITNTCEMVSNINATVVDHTAELTWTAPEGENSWTVEYKDVNNGEWQSVTASTNSLTLNDLNTNTAYDVRVRSNCGEAISNWATYQFAVPCINVVLGPVDVTIGEGMNTTYYAPFGPYYKNSWVQMIYPASAFETEGYINALSWEVDYANAQDCSSLKIYIGTTTHENNTSTTDWVPMEDLTLVYSASDITIGSAAGWETYTLNTPFYYNGEDNLVIVTSRSASEYKSLYYKATGNNTDAVMYRWNDGDVSYASHPGTSAASGRNANLPNMKIDYTGFVCDDAICKAPTNLTVTDDVANAVVTWTGVEGETSYEVQYAEEGFDEWNSAIVDNATTYVIGNLPPGGTYDVRVRTLCGEGFTSEWIQTNFMKDLYCKIPSYVEISNITSNSATITWGTGEGGTSWIVYYGEVGSDGSNAIEITTTDNSIVLTGLEPATKYRVFIKTNCGEYQSSWNAGRDFTTDCAPFTVTEVNPWFEDFEDYSGSGEKPFNCWATPVKATGGGPFVYCGYSSSCHSGANSAELKGYDNVLVLPAFTNDIHTLSLSFWATAVTPSDGTLELGILTDMNDMNSFEFVANVTGPSSRNGVGNYMGPFSFENVASTSGRIALRYHSNYGTSNSWNLDDFTVFIPQDCPAPMNVTANVNYNDNEAEITWTPFGEESNWQVEYGAEGFEPGTGTVANVTSASYTITGLTQDESYDVYVKALCSETQSSVWNGPVTFVMASPCGQSCAYTINLTDEFGDGWNGGSLTVSQNGEVLGTYTISEGNSASYSVNLCEGVDAVFTYTTGSYASENEMTVLGPSGNVVWTHAGTAGSTSEVIIPSCAIVPVPCENSCEYTFELTDYYGDGWTGYPSGSLVVEQDGELLATLTLTSGYFSSTNIELCETKPVTLTLHLDQYEDEMGLTVYDAFGNQVWHVEEGSLSGSNDVIFNFTANCSNACNAPTDLLVSDVNATSATLTWTGDTALTYEVSYMAGMDAAWTTTTVTGNTTTLTGLMENTTYFVRVKATCDASNNYAEAMFFTTASAMVCNDNTISQESGSAYYTPVNDYYNNSRSEQIYSPEEVGTAGDIKKIYFNYQGSSTMTKKTNVKIYLGHTTKNEFSSTTDWTTSGLTLVYTGNLNCSHGWNEFVLDEPFSYNGADNLLVCVDDESGQYGSSSNKFYYTNCTGYKCLTFQNDYYTWTNASSKTGTRRTYRPDIRFNICSAPTDIALTAIHNIPNACDLTNIPVTIDVKVMGSNPVSTIDVYYKANQSATVHETITLDEPLTQGESMTYTFNTLVTLPYNSNDLMAWVEIPGDGNPENNLLVAEPILNILPATIPFVETFNEGEINDGWFIRDVNGDNVTFTIANGVASYPYSDEENADDWLMTTCVDVYGSTFSPGVYDVTYSYKANDAAMTENFGVYFGEKVGDNYVMNHEVATHEFNNTEFVTVHNIINVTQSGIYYFGIHATSLAGNAGFEINDFAVRQTARIIVNAGDNGSTDPQGAVYAAKGEEYTITIHPDAGYHVLAIYRNNTLVRGENTDNASVEYYTFTPSIYEVINVTFTGNLYDVNATVTNLYATGYNNDAPGAVYTPAHETVAYGGSHTGVLTLAPNYHFVSMTVNGMSVTPVPSNLDGQYLLTLDPVMENKDINAVVAVDSARVIYNVLAGQGTINNHFVVDGNATYPAAFTETVPGYSNLWSTITPAPGYHVASIIVDGIEYNNITEYFFEHVVGTHTVDVMFVANQYTITTLAYGNGTVSPGVQFTYNPDYTYTFTATPAVGYRIASILRNNVELTVADPANGYTETLSNIVSDYTYEVLFVQNTHSVTATSGAHGTVSPAGVSNYYHGQDAVYIIDAALGYYVVSVTVDGAATTYTQADNVTSTTYTFNNISEDHTISATFAQKMYTVTVNAGTHGDITPGTGSFAFGTTPTFNIIPAAGYGIADVTVDGASVGAVNAYTFPALTADHTIAATFAAYQYTINATAGNGGTITPAGNTTLAYNGTQAYTISANAGYHVSDVFVDGASVGAVTTYTFSNVTENHIIYAAFEANEYTVAVNQPANGSITPGTTTVLYGATPAFVITPNDAYNVTAITVNGSNVALANVPNVNGTYTYTFPAISANQTITATMAMKTYTITATAGANGSINPGTQTVNYGASKTFTFAPNAGYVVANVTVDGANLGALSSYTFTNVTANHTINVTFAPAECEMPYSLYTTHIGETTAMLHWSHPTATSFDIQYKTLTSNLTSITNVSGNSYELTGLDANTTYLWQVRANCTNNNHSDWSNLVSFTTEATPIEIGIEDLVKNSIKVYAEHQNVHIVNNEGMNIDNVRIFDTYGRLIYSGSVSSEHEVIGLNVAVGTYIVNVTTDQGVANYKVTILR
jgi:hypothetical protein